MTLLETSTDIENVVPGSYATGALVFVDDPFEESSLDSMIVHVEPGPGDFLLPLLALYRRGAQAVLCHHLSKDHGIPAARELGIPLVTGIDRQIIAAEIGNIVTISGTKLHKGYVPQESTGIDEEALQLPSNMNLKLTLGFPDSVERHADLMEHVDGIAFVRLEFVILSLLRENIHPECALCEGDLDYLDKRLAEEIVKIVEPMKRLGKEAYLRTDDFSPNDLYNMQGGAELETLEQNPALGRRGIRRYAERPMLLDWQLRAMKLVLESGYDNIGLFPPMVSMREEFDTWKQTCEEALTTHADRMKWGVMIETPSAALLADQFAADTDFVIFGMNDLTQFTMAASRNDARLSHLLDPTGDPMKRLLKLALNNLQGVETILSGPPATDEAFVRELTKHGLGGISVEPDKMTVARMRRSLYNGDQ